MILKVSDLQFKEHKKAQVTSTLALVPMKVGLITQVVSMVLLLLQLSKQSAASFITGNDQNLDGNLSESEKGVGITNSTANVRIGC